MSPNEDTKAHCVPKVFSKMGMHGATGVNLYSILVSAIGAILVLVIYHGIRRAI